MIGNKVLAIGIALGGIGVGTVFIALAMDLWRCGTVGRNEWRDGFKESSGAPVNETKEYYP